jgi:hypothetical protein
MRWVRARTPIKHPLQYLTLPPPFPPDGVTVKIIDGEPYLIWEPNSDHVLGYRVYYHERLGQYPPGVNVGQVTQYPLSSLPLEEGKVYDFVTTAYDDGGESQFSSPPVSWVAHFPFGED